MKYIFLFPLIALVACSTPKKVAKIELKPMVIAFTATNGILHPESALYSHAHKTIFVSNVASGNPVETERVGYISKLSPTGEVLNAKWVTGLKAPKGLAIFGKHLYVSDVNQIAIIKISTGKIIETINVPGAKFLNDVVADKKGNIYLSDMMTDTIHILNQKGVKTWFTSPALRGPNGLYTDGKEHIIVSLWGGPINPKTFESQVLGSLTTLSLTKKNETLTEEKSISGHLDGISSDDAGNLWVSDWMNGDVYTVQKNGTAELKYNFGQGTADLSVAKELKLLLIPQMYQNKVIAVQL